MVTEKEFREGVDLLKMSEIAEKKDIDLTKLYDQPKNERKK